MTATQVRSPHLPGLPDGMPTVATVPFRKTGAVVNTAIRDRGMAAFVGDAGLGKTFSVRHAVETADMPYIWVQVGPKPSTKEVTVRILKQLTGGRTDGPLYELTDTVIGELDAQPRIVVVDEAQNLKKAGIDQIRSIHDRSVGFPLLFVGGQECGRTLRSDPQLADRIGGWVTFKPLTGPALYSTLNAYHPLLKATDPKTIARLDREYAKGAFRRWARIVKTVLELGREEDANGISQHTAKAVLAAIRYDGNER